MSVDSYIQETITRKAWGKVGISSHHGLNVPLLSLHTKKSAGCGEFLDLILLIDWCKTLGMDVVQLLPLNDSGFDPSPYNALSSCALHPIYLSLYALPRIEPFQKQLSELAALNDSKLIPYPTVYQKKMALLKNYIRTVKDDLKKESSYALFLKEHEWLQPYTLFKVLKELYKNSHWKDWKEEDRSPSSHHLHHLYEKHRSQMEYHALIQYLCFQQMQTVKKHAEKQNVFLKGDVPILVSPDSADVWHHPMFFDFSYVAGSPPSLLNQEGQYWGFPLYNWTALEENHYEWWKRRLQTAEKLYHIYRIDHILGFFRIWAIRPDHPAKTGAFLPSDPGIMEAQGRALLEIITGFTSMLPIGEDLGSVPPFVPKCLKDYGIPGTRIFRWQRKEKFSGPFLPYETYEPISMTSVSTHDLPTVKVWWKKKPEEAQEYCRFKGWTYHKNLSFEYQYEILYDNHHSGSLFHINLLQEYLALCPHLTWENPEDERINYPGTVKKRNWTYRYKMPLETLTEDKELASLIKKLVMVPSSL